MTVRMGLIGYGHVGRVQVEAIECVDGLDLVAFHDRDHSKSGLLPKRVAFHEDLDALLEDERVDVLLISTPNDTHCKIAKRVIAANKAFLVEKPAATTREDNEAVKKLALEKGVFHDVALHASHARDLRGFLDIREELTSRFGPITGFRCGFYDPYFRNGAVEERARGLGGSWRDSGINALSVILRILDRDEMWISESIMTVGDEDAGVELQASVHFGFSGGHHARRGEIDTNWTIGLNRKYTRLFFDQSDACVELDHSGECLNIFQRGEQIASHDYRTGKPRLINHYIALFETFIEKYTRGIKDDDLSNACHDLYFEALEASVHGVGDEK